MKAGCRRKVTDAMIAKLKAWKGKTWHIAADLDISDGHARAIRSGRYRHKTDVRPQ